ncbi:hypothetical protein ACIP5N_32025 [Streptomyces sp. NPDC088768]|uniref:hypothetical protein n=1 Tax=Streptomyces sp. NPDC088768 TaxID=3365894 RepID=UPI00380B58AA
MILTDRHPSTVAAVRGFAFEHLPAHLADVSRIFHQAATDLLERLPDDPELFASLRKLREAKDCAVLLAAQAPAPGGEK